MFTDKYIIEYGEIKLSAIAIQGGHKNYTSNDPKYNTKCAVIRQQMRLLSKLLFYFCKILKSEVNLYTAITKHLKVLPQVVRLLGKKYQSPATLEKLRTLIGT